MAMCRVGCEFRYAGCHWEGLPHELATHLGSQCQTHVALLSYYVKNAEEKWGQATESYQHELHAQKLLTASLQAKLSEHETRFRCINTTTTQLSNEVAEIRKDEDDSFDDDDLYDDDSDDDSYDDYDYGYGSVPQVLINLPGLSVYYGCSGYRHPGPFYYGYSAYRHPSASTITNGLFQFYVDRVSFKKCARQCHHSPAFYFNNYRMQLTVFPYGRYNARGSHISVYAHFLQGEHDDRLPWPFRGHLTVRLLSQNSGQMDHACNIVYDDSVGCDYSGRVYNSSPGGDHGIEQFLPFTAESSYIHHDQMTFELPQVADY